MKQKSTWIVRAGYMMIVACILFAVNGIQTYSAGILSQGLTDMMTLDRTGQYTITIHHGDGKFDNGNYTDDLVYDLDDGECLDDLEGFTAIPGIHREGYVFDGWYRYQDNDPASDVKVDFYSTTTIDRSYDVYPSWKEPSQYNYQIVFPQYSKALVTKWDGSAQVMDASAEEQVITGRADDNCWIKISDMNATGLMLDSVSVLSDENGLTQVSMNNGELIIRFSQNVKDYHEDVNMWLEFSYVSSSDMSIVQSPDKTEYLDGDVFDRTGLVCAYQHHSVHYDYDTTLHTGALDDSQDLVNVDSEYLTSVSMKKLTVADTSVSAHYTVYGKDLVCQIPVQVKARPVSSIKLNNISVSLNTGKTLTLTPTIAPENATNKDVTWTSSNSNVASVSSKGVVTAKSEGTATITCTATDGSGKSAECKVKVTQLVTKITLNKTTASVLKGKTLTLKATVSPSNATNSNVKWKSSNTTVAIVGSTGKITAKAVGAATITCTAADGSGVKATCKITVTRPVTKITLNKTEASVLKGKTLTLKAKVAPSNAANTAVKWKSSNTTVATVSSAGKVTAKAVGTTTITCTAADGSGIKNTCKITVTRPVTKITLNKNSASILKGKTLTLKATVGPSNATDRSVKWKSSNTNVATVSSTGKVTAKAVGTATITCTASDGSGIKNTCKITVTRPVTKITLNKTAVGINVGNNYTLKAVVGPSNATDKNVKWKSSNTTVATVNSKGVVTAKRAGAVIITCTAADGSGISSTCTVTVIQPFTNYVLNKNTKKFHMPNCSSVNEMSPHNRMDVDWTRQEIIDAGYTPCKRCNP